MRSSGELSSTSVLYRWGSGTNFFFHERMDTPNDSRQPHVEFCIVSIRNGHDEKCCTTPLMCFREGTCRWAPTNDNCNLGVDTTTASRGFIFFSR
jgi:hypothetical protein